MALTPAQLQILATDIANDPTLSAIPHDGDGNVAVAEVYNAAASPSFWVWRTNVTQAEIVQATTADGTAWSWSAYIGRSQGERDGWREMFADGGFVNASLANVRAGFADIFSGAGGAAQRAHLLTVGRRKATRGEKLFAAGVGSTASPAVMGFEGAISAADVDSARNLP